jgi:mycofactocin system glycosyltransferase
VPADRTTSRSDPAIGGAGSPTAPAPDDLAGAVVVVDADVEVVDEGRVLIGGSPVGVTRLTPAGAALVRRLIDGEPVPGGSGATALVRRLLDRGVAHPAPAPASGPAPSEVTIVVPVHGRLDPALVAHLAHAVDDGIAEVIIVDDASVVPVDDIAARSVRIVRRSVNGGPAAARNTGLAEVATAVVAFVDADCVPAPGWLDALLPHLSDPLVAAVAPRVVTGADGTGTQSGRASARQRYEAARGVLDLGDRAARVRPGTRVGHVPTTALVTRAEAVRALDGFDEAMRIGEDVDLVWRLDRAGWTVRFEPASEVVHRTRASLRAWLAQRRGYGSSAGPLARRHPHALAPLEVPLTTAATWLLVARGHRAAAATIALASTGALSRRLRGIDAPLATAATLTARAHARAVAAAATAVVRPWWPLALLGLCHRRTRRVVVVAALAPPAIAWVRRRPQLDPVRWTALWLADDVAYGTGVWLGAWRARTPGPLLPRFTGHRGHGRGI